VGRKADGALVVQRLGERCIPQLGRAFAPVFGQDVQYRDGCLDKAIALLRRHSLSPSPSLRLAAIARSFAVVDA
jgi:hypothetical protein